MPSLSASERMDRAILLELLDKLRFGDEVLRDEAWDPLSLVYLAGSGLFGILSREYAPWSERGAAFTARVEGLPALLADGLEGLTGLADRPVSLLHLDTALAQLAGVPDLVDEGLEEARRARGRRRGTRARGPARGRPDRGPGRRRAVPLGAR